MCMCEEEIVWTRFSAFLPAVRQPGHGSIPRNTAWAFLRLHLAWYNCLKPTTGSGACLPQTDINPASSPNWYQLQFDSSTSRVRSRSCYRQKTSNIWSDTVKCARTDTTSRHTRLPTDLCFRSSAHGCGSKYRHVFPGWLMSCFWNGSNPNVHTCCLGAISFSFSQQL